MAPRRFLANEGRAVITGECTSFRTDERPRADTNLREYGETQDPLFHAKGVGHRRKMSAESDGAAANVIMSGRTDANHSADKPLPRD